MDIFRGVILLTTYLIWSFNGVKLTRLSNRKFIYENQYPWLTMSRNDEQRNNTFHKLIFPPTINQPYIRRNIKLYTGVFSMRIYLEPWQILCVAKILTKGRYGCYCGIGNPMKNGKPVDELDWTCFAHDLCYYATEQIKNCQFKNAPFMKYKWVNDNGKVSNVCETL